MFSQAMRARLPNLTSKALEAIKAEEGDVERHFHF